MDEEEIILRNFQNKVYRYKNYSDKNNPEGYGSKRKKTNGKKPAKTGSNGKPEKKKVEEPVLVEV
jgi:hypothetical protein